MSTTNTTPYATHVSDTPLTTAITDSLQPGLLRSHVDERVCRIRPSLTPLDQISRMVGTRRAGSMKVEYYSVDTKPGSTTLRSALTARELSSGQVLSLEVTDVGVISPTETVMIPGVSINVGINSTPLVCYVRSAKDHDLELIPVLPAEDKVDKVSIPALSAKTRIVRMGRAAGELDVQTSQYSVIPTKAFNFCQIFKAQVEESLLQRLSDKEVGWSFSDQEENAIADMRLGMEKSFLFGSRTRLSMPEGSELYFTGGIWAQAGREFPVDTENLDENTLTDMLCRAFTGGGGSSQKVLLAGSELISALSKIDRVRVLADGEKKVVWGIDFDRITSKFGTVYVKLSEIFDLCGMPGSGIIIDPEYITKYSHVPFSAERISFQKQGLRNTEGVVLTEASCLVLRYPEAHMRIVEQ